MSSLQTSLLRQEAAMLRQLRALERASMQSRLRELQLAYIQDPRLRAQLTHLQQLHARTTPTETRLEAVENQLRYLEHEGTRDAADALLELQHLAGAQWHAPDQEVDEVLDDPDQDDTDDERDERADPGRESQTCIMCNSRKRAVVCLPCGHLGACNMCWRRWTRRTPAPTCATCRAPVSRTLQASQQQRDDADAAPTRHGGSADGAVPPGILYMNARLPALAAMQLCLDRRACCCDHTSV